MSEFDHTNPETLVELYHRRNLTQSEVGELCGVSGTTIKRWLDRHDIDSRSPRPQDIVRDIRSLGDGAPTQDEYRKHGQYSVNAAKNRFGSWNDAVEATGYEPRTESKPADSADLLTDLEELAAELGRTPSQLDINQHSKHSHKTYYRIFDGGLREAQQRVGLEPNEQATRERVTFECDAPNCERPVEKTPSEAESEYHYCSQDCHYRHNSERYSGLDNPNSTLAVVECFACGAEIERATWQRERYERYYCTDCWGNSKQIVECEVCGEQIEALPSRTEARRFCSRECHGTWISKHNVGERHPRFKSGRRPEYYGPNWERQRRAAVRRDEGRCQDCGRTIVDSVEEFGEVLSVHHKTPFRDFVDGDDVDYESANELSNLVTLCRPCHSQRETQNDRTEY